MNEMYDYFRDGIDFNVKKIIGHLLESCSLALTALQMSLKRALVGSSSDRV